MQPGGATRPVTACAPALAVPRLAEKGDLSRMTAVPVEATPGGAGIGDAVDGAWTTPDPGASTIPDSEFAEAHRNLIADNSIQFQLPHEEPVEPSPVVVDFVGALLPVLQVLFWAVLGAAALYLLYAIATRLSGAEWPWRRRRREQIDEAQDWRPDAAPARQLLGDADALAATGRYSEAARLLLYRSIEDIDARRPDLVRPALTSRDIAALPAIPERPRSAFAGIAMLVERSLFAGRPLGESDWSACRAAYEDFAFAEGWRG